MTQLSSKVNPDVSYTQDAFALNGGLDFTTSKLTVEKGSLLDCLNFEVVDRLGYQTIAGFDRFDGSLSPDQVEFWVFPVEAESAVPPVGSVFRSAAEPFVYYGVVVATPTVTTTDWVVYARYNADNVPANGEDLLGLTSSTPIPFNPAAVPVRYQGSALDEDDSTAATILALYQTWNAVLRNRVTSLHSTPIGLHWYRDRLYAVCDEAQMAFTSIITTELLPNMIIRNLAGTFVGRILDVALSSGTWAGSDATGMALVEPLEFFNGLETVYNPTPPIISQVDVLAEVPTPSNWDDPANTLISDIVFARELEDTDPLPTYAGMWRTNPEPTPGWSRINSGWELDFDNGFSDTDTFTKIERSVTNNFTLTTDDEEGVSINFLNGIGIPTEEVLFNPPTFYNYQRGNPGWRDTNSISSFATSQEALETEDSRFLQADARWSLGYESGTVPVLTALGAAPGYTSSSYNGYMGSVSWGTNTNPVNFDNAGNSNAYATLLFDDLRQILGAIPTDAKITGIELDIDYDLSAQYTGQIPNVEATNFVSDTLSDKFRLEAYIGEIDFENGVFATKGSKQSTALPVPTTLAGWTASDVGTPGTNLTPIQAVHNVTGASATVGGSGNLFGLSVLPAEDLNKPEFGIALWGGLSQYQQFASNPTGDWSLLEGSARADLIGATRFKLNRLRIKLYYTQPSARYYFVDGTDIASADLVNYVVAEGNLSAGNGVGTFQITNIQSVAGDKTHITTGDTVHLTSTPTSANQIAVITAPMRLNGLPALQDIVREASRYQFITANFYAREDWDGFYGVSGAGKAFSFADFDPDESGTNSQYISKITTNTFVQDEDKPRHVAKHQYRLALGYKDGVVRFSAAGDPENYDGLDGAIEVGVGDRVTGLLAMKGKALGVFCDSSIYTILGSTDADFTVETLAPYTGAIEYTVVDMGIPMYCDTRGISTLDQSDKYGNFQGVRVSQRVSPWILPRMTRSDDLFSLTNGAGVVSAVPVRSKNQYRLFFRDGRVLVLTLNGDGSSAFTFSQYFLENDSDHDDARFFVPIAHSSQVDNNGVERTHMSHYSPRSEASSNYVFEFERGYGFDGYWFPAQFTTNWAYQDPFRSSTIRCIRADGLTKGAGWAKITVGKDYDQTSYSTTTQPISLPRNPASEVYNDFTPTSTMAHVAKGMGRALSLRVEKSTASGEKVLTLPFVYQVMLAQYEPGGKADN